MEPGPVALVFLRHRSEVLVFDRAQDQTGESGNWCVPTGHTGETPRQMAHSAVETETPVETDQVALQREGTPFEYEGITDGTLTNSAEQPPDEDGSLDYPVRIHPFLFECEDRESFTATTSAVEWIQPTALLDRESQWPLWRAYDRVRPTVETIEADAVHGSTTLSIRSLEVLRDEAALLARDESEFSSVEAVGQALVSARPSMTAVTNRVCRAIATVASPRTPAQITESAHDGIQRALRTDTEVAAIAAGRIEGARVATLSRSGTVLQTLDRAEPDAVLVAESRPGGEGVAVAQEVSELAETTVTSDAAFPSQLGDWNADVLLVGADSILADGRVVNKVGTYGATLAANRQDIPVTVVAATDKISPDTTFDPEHRDDSEIATDSEAIEIANPTFESTPHSCIDAVVTERGVLDADAIQNIAAEYESWLSIFVEVDAEER